MTSDGHLEETREPEVAFNHELDLSPHDPRGEAIARQRGMSEDEIAMIKAGLKASREGRFSPSSEVFARLAAKHGG